MFISAAPFCSLCFFSLCLLYSYFPKRLFHMCLRPGGGLSHRKKKKNKKKKEKNKWSGAKQRVFFLRHERLLLSKAEKVSAMCSSSQMLSLTYIITAVRSSTCNSVDLFFFFDTFLPKEPSKPCIFSSIRAWYLKTPKVEHNIFALEVVYLRFSLLGRDHLRQEGVCVWGGGAEVSKMWLNTTYLSWRDPGWREFKGENEVKKAETNQRKKQM